jgi:hypothetical protein
LKLAGGQASSAGVNVASGQEVLSQAP